MNTKTRRITAYTVVALIVKLYLIGALMISFSHIVHASAMLGLTGWQAWTVPAFIDGFAILGMIGRTDGVASRTEDPAAVRRFGFHLQLVAGSLSLAANVFAGATVGERAFGALVVTGFVVAEKYAEKLRASKVGADAEAAVQARVAAAVTEALAADAAGRRKAEQAQARRDRAAAKRVGLAAQLSPATVNEIESAYPAAASAYEPAYL
jgi:hypothetical protein